MRHALVDKAIAYIPTIDFLDVGLAGDRRFFQRTLMTIGQQIIGEVTAD